MAEQADPLLNPDLLRIEAAGMAHLDGGELELDLGDADKCVEIVRMISPEERSGAGTRALQTMTAEADQLGVTLTLWPDGSYYEDEAAAEARLRAFYGRFGFITERSGDMRRLPQRSQEPTCG